jgi:hypothetical protein
VLLVGLGGNLWCRGKWRKALGFSVLRWAAVGVLECPAFDVLYPPYIRIKEPSLCALQ